MLNRDEMDEMVSGMQEGLGNFISGLHRERLIHGERRTVTQEELELVTRIYQIGYAAGFRRGTSCLPTVTR